MKRGNGMAINYQSIVSEGLSKQIARSIRKAILDGNLQVDERLPTEEELAKQFSVSRPTVREALKRLAAQNLIRTQRGPSGGTFVNKPSFEESVNSIYTITTLLASIGEFNLHEIAEARAELECVFSRFACANRREDHLEAMARELASQKTMKLSDAEFCRSDVRFHQQIALATDNAVLILVSRAILEPLHPSANMTAFKYQDYSVITRFHERLLDCIRDRDAACAEDVIRSQMHYYQETYEHALDVKRQESAASPF